MSIVEPVGKKYKSLILVMATPLDMSAFQIAAASHYALLSGCLHVGRIVVAMWDNQSRGDHTLQYQSDSGLDVPQACVYTSSSFEEQSTPFSRCAFNPPTFNTQATDC